MDIDLSISELKAKREKSLLAKECLSYKAENREQKNQQNLKWNKFNEMSFVLDAVAAC